MPPDAARRLKAPSTAEAVAPLVPAQTTGVRSLRGLLPGVRPTNDNDCVRKQRNEAKARRMGDDPHLAKRRARAQRTATNTT